MAGASGKHSRATSLLASFGSVLTLWSLGADLPGRDVSCLVSERLEFAILR